MARRRATYAQLEALPPQMVGELIDGELVATPRPTLRHARVSSRLGARLGGPFDEGRGGPGGWVLLDEPELHLRADVLVPDIGGWRRERMPEIPDVVGIKLVPDWVCEVLSPSTEKIDRLRKLRVYARERVKHVWLLNPITSTLEILQLDKKRSWKLLGVHGGDDKVRAKPFEAILLDLAPLWER